MSLLHRDEVRDEITGKLYEVRLSFRDKDGDSVRIDVEPCGVLWVAEASSIVRLPSEDTILLLKVIAEVVTWEIES